MSEKPELRDLLLPLILVTAVFFVVVLIPPLGILAGILAPAPLLFVYLQRGMQVGVILMVLVFAALYTLMGPGQAILFFAEYAVMAAVMAETIKAGFSMDRCVLFSTLASSMLSILLLVMLYGSQEKSVTDFFQEQIESHFHQSMETLKETGQAPADMNAMTEFVEGTSRTFASAYPAFIVVGSMMTAVINFFLVRLAWRRLYGETVFPQGKFSQWVLDEQWIWPLILSGAFVFLLSGEAKTLGLNLFLVMLWVYFLHGMAIAIHIMEAKNLPRFLWALFFLLTLIQPMLIGLIAGLGVFDIWVDFRKLRKKPAAEDEPE